MGLVAVCKKCGRTIRGRDELAGRPFRCPDCHELNEFPIRSSAATVADHPPAVAQSPESEKPAKEKASRICPVCGFDLWVDPDQITDVKGRRMHRACFEEVRPHEKPEPTDMAVVELFQRSESQQAEPARPKPPAGKSAERKAAPSRPARPKPPAQAPPRDGDFLEALPVAPAAVPDDLPEAIPEVVLEAIPEALFDAIPEALPMDLPETLPDKGSKGKVPRKRPRPARE